MSAGLRDALENAFDQATGDEAPAAVEPAPVAAEPAGDLPSLARDDGGERATESVSQADGEASVDVGAGRARDDKGRFAKAKAEAAAKVAAEKKPVLTAVPSVPAEGQPVEPKPNAPPAEAIKAPQSWKPTAREKWAALPPEVQQEINRIEHETKATLREVAVARKFHSDFAQVTAPYEVLMRAQGVNALQAVDTFFRTEAALRTGTPSQRAMVMAQLVKNYGVDISALDSALSGQAPQGQPQQGEYRDPRVDQLLAEAQRAKAMNAQRMAAKTHSEIETLARELEFFDDVREDMADIIETRARRGIEISPKDAYALAVKMNPEISAVVAQREAAKAAGNVQASTQRARAAASSVQSRPAGVTSSPQPNGIRGALEAAIAAHSGR